MADYLKIPEVARRLDVSEPTVRRMVKGGKLPSVFIGGAYRVSEADLEKFLEDAKVKPGKVRAPALEPSLTDALEDLRRTTALYESFHAIVEAVDGYRELWEKRLEVEDPDKIAFEEAGRAIEAFWPAVVTAAEAEMADLTRGGMAPEKAAAQSVLLPAMARFQALGERVNSKYREKFKNARIYAFPQREAS